MEHDESNWMERTMERIQKQSSNLLQRANMKLSHNLNQIEPEAQTVGTDARPCSSATETDVLFREFSASMRSVSALCKKYCVTSSMGSISAESLAHCQKYHGLVPSASRSPGEDANIVDIHGRPLEVLDCEAGDVAEERMEVVDEESEQDYVNPQHLNHLHHLSSRSSLRLIPRRSDDTLLKQPHTAMSHDDLSAVGNSCTNTTCPKNQLGTLLKHQPTMKPLYHLSTISSGSNEYNEKVYNATTGSKGRHADHTLKQPYATKPLDQFSELSAGTYGQSGITSTATTDSKIRIADQTLLKQPYIHKSTNPLGSYGHIKAMSRKSSYFTTRGNLANLKSVTSVRPGSKGNPVISEAGISVLARSKINMMNLKPTGSMTTGSKVKPVISKSASVTTNAVSKPKISARIDRHACRKCTELPAHSVTVVQHIHHSSMQCLPDLVGGCKTGLKGKEICETRLGIEEINKAKFGNDENRIPLPGDNAGNATLMIETRGARFENKEIMRSRLGSNENGRPYLGDRNFMKDNLGGDNRGANFESKYFRGARLQSDSRGAKLAGCDISKLDKQENVCRSKPNVLWCRNVNECGTFGPARKLVSVYREN